MKIGGGTLFGRLAFAFLVVCAIGIGRGNWGCCSFIRATCLRFTRSRITGRMW